MSPSSAGYDLSVGIRSVPERHIRTNVSSHPNFLHMDNNEPAPVVPIIDHVGIAVNSLGEARERWSALLGLEPSEEEIIESEGVTVSFFGSGPGRVELIAPAGDDSPIARFLASRGPGIHHVCARVPDLEAALDRAEGGGAETIAPRIRVGASGTRVAFLHPRTVDGVLLELREDRDAK